MTAVARWAAAVAITVAGAWALGRTLGPWPAALILGPVLWTAAVWILGRFDRALDAPAPAPSSGQGTPGAHLGQLDRHQVEALGELSTAYMRWRHQQSHRGGRGAA